MGQFIVIRSVTVNNEIQSRGKRRCTLTVTQFQYQRINEFIELNESEMKIDSKFHV